MTPIHPFKRSQSNFEKSERHWGIEMGLAWWMKKAEISADQYFFFLPMPLPPSPTVVNPQELEAIEREFTDGSVISTSTVGRLLVLREQQKNNIFSDLNLALTQCTTNRMVIPTSEDLLPDEILELAQDFVKTLHLLTNNG